MHARSLVSAVLALGLSCATAPAVSGPPAEPVPELIGVPAGNSLLVTLRAKGVQIYVCTPGKDGGPLGWNLKAPRADLFDATGMTVARHGAGPSWNFLRNDSQVMGEVLQKLPPKGPNIPWLLLKVKSAREVSPYGSVLFIQRLDTSGGVAPASGCEDGKTGAEVEVPYTATYAFWGTPG